MKKRKHFKLKRLIIRIVSVISIISILISSVVFSVSADVNDVTIPADSVSVNVLRLNQGWSIGSYGSPIAEGIRGQFYYSDGGIIPDGGFDFAYLLNNSYITIPNSSTSYSINGRLIYISYVLKEPYYLKAGSYDVSIPMSMYYGSVSSQAPVNGTVSTVVSNLVDNPNNVWVTNWFENSSIPFSNGWINFNFNVQVSSPMYITHFRVGFVVNSSNGLYNNYTTIYLRDKITLSYSPLYIMPDFSDQDNNQVLEDGIRENGSDAFAQLDNFYDSLGHLGESFDFIKTSMFKSTFIFSTLFTEDSLLSDLLYFALVIGLSGFIIGVIGSVAGWSIGFGSRENNKRNRR